MFLDSLETDDMKKARQSLIEELEAISAYEKRIDESEDEELKRILEHNMNEEKEHVAMLLEWMRKNDEEQDQAFKEHD
ncbi:MAG: ferritin [Candidatus Pacearchaeota archaeon]